MKKNDLEIIFFPPNEGETTDSEDRLFRALNLLLSKNELYDSIKHGEDHLIKK